MSVAKGDGGDKGPALQTWLEEFKEAVAGGMGEKKSPKVVHLLKNQPPLHHKVVEKIREGAFVEFASFPVFDDGPADTGEGKGSMGELGEGTSSGVASRKKSIKEIPSLQDWSICFTLYQVAWATSNPEMWVPLAAYREIIFRLAKRAPWAKVARYDRRFRQEAAGKEDTKWDEENISLMLHITGASMQGSTETRQNTSGSSSMTRKTEAKRRGACFRFNKGDGKCNFGAQCRFAHVCSNCGGEHSLMQCSKPPEKK